MRSLPVARIVMPQLHRISDALPGRNAAFFVAFLDVFGLALACPYKQIYRLLAWSLSFLQSRANWLAHEKFRVRADTSGKGIAAALNGAVP